MSLLMRSSTRVFQHMKRTLCTAATPNASEKQSDVVLRSRKAIYFRPIIESDLLINVKMRNDEPFDDHYWNEVRKQLLKQTGVTELNVDSMVYDICCHYEKLKEAQNYIKFLEHNNFKLNLNILSSYLRTFILTKEDITEEDEKEISRIYEKIRGEYPLLDPKTATNCVLALSMTKRWKESLELIKMIELVARPGVSVFSAYASAAFKNNEPNIGWSVLRDSISKMPMFPSVYIYYLKFCKNNFADNELQKNIDKMFDFWRENNVLPAEFVIQEYSGVYKSFGYSTTDTSISHNGSCKSCSHILQPTTLTVADFKTLSALILKNLIVGENVFCKTSPQELKRYMIFLESMKPYDVVIDGLNVAYAAVNKKNPQKRPSLSNIIQVVDYFLQRGKKRILVIGRAHMNWWSVEKMRELQKKADVFLIKNLSQDDPFLLHVTIMSGAQTHFVSRDFMRGHKSDLVDKNCKQLFKRWQLSRQYFFKTAGNSIKLIPPIPFEPFTQKNENGWHIPYTTAESLLTPDNYEAPTNWICLRKKT